MKATRARNTFPGCRIRSCTHPALQRAITYTDPDLNIDFNVEHPILSAQDANAPYLKDSDCNY
jgi:dTDP-4-dehydrorhamnose 3,5-epimerase-like enzyme